MASWLQSALKLIFAITATALAWFDIPAAVVFICASILVALTGKLGSLAEVSFGPLRAKIEHNIHEAENLLEELKSLAAIQSKAILDAAAHANRFTSPNTRNYQTLVALDNHLAKIGVATERRLEARSQLIETTVADAARAALGGSFQPRHLGETAVSEWQKLHEDSLKSPDRIEEFLRKYNSLTTERATLIADMRSLLKSRHITDEAQFMRSQTPIVWTKQVNQ